MNSLNINNEVDYGLEAFDAPPPAKREEWAQAVDGDGAGLIRVPKYENRVVTMSLRVGKQASMDAALAKIGALADLLQEAELNPGGIPLVFTPATGSKSFTLYVLTGRITAVEQVNEGPGAGFYVFMPLLKVQLTCRPFGYGAEEEVAAAKSIETGLSTVILTVPTVLGDVPAEARLVVKDTAKVGRRTVEWGVQNRFYDAATSLIEAAEAMTPVGGTRSEAANTGAYSPSSTKKTIATTLLPEPTICLETGVLKHVGVYGVKLRAQAVLGAGSLAEKIKVRLSYQDGEGPFRANPWQTPVLGGKYVEVDLGTITLTEKITGTQKWVGRVEAYSTNEAAKDVLHANYLTFVPCFEGWGKARGQASAAAGTVVAFDNFTTGTLSGSLNTRTPATGAAWATSGSATDWAVSAGEILRKTTSDTEPHYGVLGAAIGNSAISFSFSVPGGTCGAILRWVDKENYAFFLAKESAGPVKLTFSLGVKVAGVTTILAEQVGTYVERVEGTLATTVDGALSVKLTGALNVSLAGSHASLATGGALASGKGGIYDYNPGGTIWSRRFYSVSVAQLPAVPYVVQSERTLEIRSDSTLVQDSTGTYVGPPPEYRGSRFYLPQDGSANRTSRVIVKADRNDLEEADQQTIGDAFTAQIFATPRYAVLPR
ncbi:MAG TPA: hypothetical protein VN618_08140 [Solirubrobacteraceae bacterium]|nr:hypothetical protein [Solirubrobacteraceae bacterium]